jgi:hypothetical protein
VGEEEVEKKEIHAPPHCCPHFNKTSGALNPLVPARFAFIGTLNSKYTMSDSQSRAPSTTTTRKGRRKDERGKPIGK